ncbi:hypothetical protein ACWD4O_38905 [Streptomyces sp. NPDC002623]
MNTTAAAIQANVTADTIRTWCRRGAVAALKQAGRWIIDTASLAHRIAIGQRRIRKAAVTSHEPVEIRIDDTTTIRAHHQISPAYGTGTWYAYEYTNGYRTGCDSDGSTAQEAIDKATRAHHDKRAASDDLATLESLGVYSDLTAGYTGGIYGQLDSLTCEPRRLGPGECPTCGLDARTCDCR